MKRRQMMAVLICSAVTAGMFGGYAKADETSSDEIVEIFWQYPSANEVGEGFYRMEDALNEMMEKDIGVHVTFIPTDITSSQQDATLMIASGEQLDIALTAFTSFGNLVDSGLILPIDEYVEENAPYIMENGAASVAGCYYAGQLYGLPACLDRTYVTNGYTMKAEYCDKYGFEKNDDKIYTLDEIEEMFAIVKEGEGDNFYMTTPWNNTIEPLNYAYKEYDPVSGSFSGGVLMLNRSFEDLTLYNYFETDEYREYCERMYDWAQKGYIAADAAVDSDYATRAVESNYLGSFGHNNRYSNMNYNSSSWGQDVVQFRTQDGFVKLNGGSSLTWNIPITCANPEKAVQAIDYVIANVEAATLIQYGFEGEEYEVVEDDGVNKVIKYLADDVSQLPYFNNYGLWGDRLTIPATYPQSIDFNQTQREYDESIPESRKSPALGYSFNSSSVSSEIAAVETVMEQYCHSFNAGALDPDQALPEFIDALKAAGIDKVIEENQRQLDEWAAENK